jgi:hypothetical protein
VNSFATVAEFITVFCRYAFSQLAGPKCMTINMCGSTKCFVVKGSSYSKGFGTVTCAPWEKVAGITNCDYSEKIDLMEKIFVLVSISFSLSFFSPPNSFLCYRKFSNVSSRFSKFFPPKLYLQLEKSLSRTCLIKYSLLPMVAGPTHKMALKQPEQKKNDGRK